MSNMTSTALQVTDFNFYGDNLIALKDNSTGEIYTAITHILRTLYETMVDNLLAKYNLTENLSDTKYKTIFDNQ